MPVYKLISLQIQLHRFEDYDTMGDEAFRTIMKVFIKRKILFIETVLSTHTHTHTHTLTYTHTDREKESHPYTGAY